MAALGCRSRFRGFRPRRCGRARLGCGRRADHWASPAAGALRDALAGESGGSVAPCLRGRERLKALAGGLAPETGMRLERLRLDPSRLAPPVTCACRLLTARVGGGGARHGHRRYAPQDCPAAPAISPDEPASAAPEHARSTFRRTGTVRFVWQADPDGRFTRVSPATSEVVGPMAAAIVGRTWADLTASVVRDRTGISLLSCARARPSAAARSSGASTAPTSRCRSIGPGCRSTGRRN